MKRITDYSASVDVVLFFEVSRYIATPTGISMTPKNTIEALSARDVPFSVHFCHIQWVTNISPATICAQAAAAPGLEPIITASPSKIPPGLAESFARSTNPCGSDIVMPHQIRMGPKKNQGPCIAFFVNS